MNYIEEVAAAIRAEVPAMKLPSDPSDGLFRIYAALALSKGVDTSAEDVHHAWTAWVSRHDPEHKAAVPFDQLPKAVQKQDQVFVDAIQAVAKRQGDGALFESRLFPQGTPLPSQSLSVVTDLYKVMVGSSENLVGRRQGLNTFFLSANGVLVTAAGLLLGSTAHAQIKMVGLIAISLTGIVFGAAWRGLIKSYGQLNSGKFKVINRIEKELPIAVFDAEWCALGEGRDGAKYRSFTEREVWTPRWLILLYVAVLVGSAVELIVPDSLAQAAAGLWQKIT